MFWCLRLPFLEEFVMLLEKLYCRNNLEIFQTTCQPLTWRPDPWNKKKPERKKLLLMRPCRGLRLWRKSYLPEQLWWIVWLSTDQSIVAWQNGTYKPHWHISWISDNHPRLKGFINDIPHCKQQIADLGVRNCAELVAWYMSFSLGGLGCLIQTSNAYIIVFAQNMR